MGRLLWKEWHEQSWKLAFGCVVLGAMTLIGLHTRIIADEAMMKTVCFLGLTLLPVLASTGLVPAERADGSFESLIALPVSPYRILWAKSVMGVLLCVGPLMVAGCVSWIVAGGREMPSAGVAILFARSALTTVSLFIWMMALTIRLPNETRAGLLSVGILIIAVITDFGIFEAKGAAGPWLAAASPLGFVGFGTRQLAPIALMLFEQTIIAIALWFWASRQMNNFAQRPE